MSALSAMNTVRLFAAVLPPEDVSGQLADVVAGLRSLPGSDGLRWTGVPGWHFTLAFYGEVAEDVVPELSERLARAAQRTEGFALSVRGGGQFGHGRALWAGAGGEVGVLRVLAGLAEEAGRGAGVEMGEHRHYKAHLTVARSREAFETRPYVEVLDGFTSRTWTVGELALVRSNLPRAGVVGEQPRYEVVGRWVLGSGRRGGV
ncbi:RNA 2',3'-cyclic phosphodiesterase [Streptomyces geranii]|uniref:RNA 2',3'-cyclic phosphodiesterase n=1 Tax=Streptomyces geranii TaxID=2058923 RepID=UPI0018E4F197|nr:RNA 2',3'-cyclic phosphodiesterase [Streptomyces geranii]